MPDLQAMPRSDPDVCPRAVGEVVQLNGGGPWGLVVDVDDGNCSVGYKRSGKVVEYVVPCNCLHRTTR